jgi:hypothetical protein
MLTEETIKTDTYQRRAKKNEEVIIITIDNIDYKRAMC